PLVTADGVAGLLFAGWRHPRDADSGLMAAAESLAGCAAVAIRTARLLEAERASRAAADASAVASHALAEAGRLLTSALERDLDAVLDALVIQAGVLTATPGVAVMLVEPGTGRLLIRRPNPLAGADTPQASASSEREMDDFLAEAIA